MSEKLFSIQIERHVLSGFLKHPEVFPEVDAFITDSDFVNPTHQTLYLIIRSKLVKNEKIDCVVLAQQVKNLKVKLADDIDIFEYLKALAGSQINQSGAISACKELVKLRIRREILESTQKVQEFVFKSGDMDVDSIISKADKIYNNKISKYSSSNEPVDVFADLNDLIESRINSPVKIIGYNSPYPCFNRYFGGFRPGNLYAFVSRPGVGKSSILNDIAYKCTVIDPELKALIIDFENITDDMRFRSASAISQIPCAYLETGKFAGNKELSEKYERAKSKIASHKGKVFHAQVSGKSFDEIISIIRRWYYRSVGRGGKAIVIVDYLKLSGEFDSNRKEYELIGQIVNDLKELAVDLNIPILTANQLNRSGEGSLGIDDSSAISQSDRLQWFCSFVAIFRRKRLEEIAEDGPEYGTHKMIVLKSRFQGEESTGHFDLVKIKNPTGKGFTYKQNFLSFSIDNFNVTEIGDYREILRKKAENYDISDEDSDDQSVLV